LVQVMHKDTTWPASRLRMNLFVQMLTNRAQKVLKKTDGESNRIFGLTISSVLTDRVGSALSSYLDGIGEADRCLVAFERDPTLESMAVPGEEGRLWGRAWNKKLTSMSYIRWWTPLPSLQSGFLNLVTHAVTASVGRGGGETYGVLKSN
jgi:hypothetical protein